MTLRPRPSRRSGLSRPGLTLIEVILAVLLLSLTISVVMGAVASIAGNDAYERRRLAASEIANRLMLTFLDDEKSMPPKHEAIEYGAYRFLWRMDKTIATMAINRKQESAGVTLQKLDRYQLICITVYDALQDGNYEVEGEPLAYLTRIIDPFVARNPDTIDAFGSDLDRIKGMIDNIVGTGGAGATPAKLQGRQLK